MFSNISLFWNRLTETGSTVLSTEREKRDVRLFNRTWITVAIIQALCVVSHLMNGLQVAAYTTIWFTGALCSLYFIVKRGHINLAKMFAIIFISIDTSVNAVVFGEHTHVIDFLLLAAISPYIFSI